MLERYRNIYILTREGKEYSKEGCLYVEKMIRDKVDDPCEFVYSMGAVYNNTEHMKKCLVNNPRSYVVISTNKDISILSGDAIKTFKERLTNIKNKTSWEIAVDFAEELKTA